MTDPDMYPFAYTVSLVKESVKKKQFFSYPVALATINIAWNETHKTRPGGIARAENLPNTSLMKQHIMGLYANIIAWKKSENRSLTREEDEWSTRIDQAIVEEKAVQDALAQAELDIAMEDALEDVPQDEDDSQKSVTDE